MRKYLSLHALITGIIAASIALPRVAWGTEASEIEEVRREMRLLQAQVAALRAAIAEAAELDRQSAAILTRALKNLPAAPESASATPAPKSEPASSSRPAPSLGEAPARSTARAEAASSRRSAPPPAAEPAIGGVHGKVDVPSGEPVAYVYVENVLAPSVKGERKVIQQSGKKFVPGWAVVQRGTSIAFPNQDNIYHNVFSLSAGNSFDLGLYNSSAEAKTHTFSEAGAVDVYCNIHPQMSASVLVVPNRYYAKVKSDGTFEIPGVPIGRRKVVAWSPGSRMVSEWVEVSAGKSAELGLKLDLKAAGHKNKSGQSYGSYE